MPSCVPKPCGYLDTPKNAKITFQSPSGYDLGFGSKAYIECAPGYVSTRQSILTCHHDGTWTGDVYQCIPVSWQQIAFSQKVILCRYHVEVHQHLRMDIPECHSREEHIFQTTVVTKAIS